VEGLPVVTIGQTLEQGLDSIRPGKRDRVTVGDANRNFLVFRADSPFGPRLAGGAEVFNELRMAVYFDRSADVWNVL
jgi:hypothetical protein